VPICGIFISILSLGYIGRVLQEIPGVVIVDALEGPPDVIIVMEAAEREQLAKWTIEALSSVETLTEQVRLLPTRERLNTTNSPKFSPVSGGRGKRRS